jgi:hypothetical protein
MDPNPYARPAGDEPDRVGFRWPRLSAIAWGLAVVFAAFALIAVLDLFALALLRVQPVATRVGFANVPGHCLLCASVSLCED